MKISFRARIGVLFVLLIAAVQGAALFAVLLTVRHNVLTRADAKLQAGERVFHQLVDSRGARLMQNVKILAADFGFRKAAATGDAATIRSVLANHGSRVGADAAILLSLDGDVIAATRTPRANGAIHFSRLLGRAENQGSATGLVMLDNAAYQVVVVPVYAPVRIAWVVMGFRLDQAFARHVLALTNLNLSLIMVNGPAGSLSPISTLPAGAQSALASVHLARAPLNQTHTIQLNDERWLTLGVPLLHDGRIRALLQTSASAALLPYRQVRSRLIIVSAVTLALFILGTLLLVRNVTRPVKELVQAAQRMGRGDYSSAAPIRGDELGQLAEAFNTMQAAISERERQISFQANRDGLTGLPNRSLGLARIGDALEEGAPGAVIVIDVDHFKETNDTLGYDIGDGVLDAVSRRLIEAVSEVDTVARLGADEFMVLLRKAGMDNAFARTDELLRHVGRPIQLDNITLYIELSTGIACFPAHGTEAGTVLRRAGMAMYDAKTKRSGRELYQDGRDEQRLDELALMSHFRGAVNDGEMRVYYQPKARMRDGEVISVEALARWQHPERGLVSPGVFVPLAEHSGNIRWLSEWMLRAVIVQLRKWADDGIELSASVNLSTLDLVDTRLADRVNKLLNQYSVSPERLMLEVTETAALRDTPASKANLTQLRQSGVRIAIDDFGTGYSSLAQLRSLPVDELKIDKTFVMGLEKNRQDEAIVRSAIELGANLDLSVVAEGVETNEAWSMLASYQCDIAQGHLLSRPVPVDELISWLRQYRKKNKQGEACA